MALILWADWFRLSVTDNHWIGTWESLFVMLKTTVVLFTQVVLAKIKQYYET
jgi:hypothetical protein